MFYGLSIFLKFIFSIGQNFIKKRFEWGQVIDDTQRPRRLPYENAIWRHNVHPNQKSFDHVRLNCYKSRKNLVTDLVTSPANIYLFEVNSRKLEKGVKYVQI